MFSYIFGEASDSSVNATIVFKESWQKCSVSTYLPWCWRRNWVPSMIELTVIFNPSYVYDDMNILWRASLEKFPWRCSTEFSQSWKYCRKTLQNHENLGSLTDLNGANWFSFKFMRLGISNIDNVKKQSIDEQKRAVPADYGGPYTNRTLLIAELRAWAAKPYISFWVRGQLDVFISKLWQNM